MRFSKNHCKIQFIICACLLTVVICDRGIQSSRGTTKFHPKDSLASKSAQHIESKLGSESSPSKLHHHLNQATNHRQPSDVENKKSAPFHHADMECSGMKCPKTHEAAPSESQYPGQLPQNNTRAQVQTSDLRPPLPTETTDTESPLVENGIYWSREVEELLPKGLTDEQYNAWTKKVGHLTVIYMEKGTLTKCGRDGNAYVILSDGTQMCVRHSKHGNTGLLGELYAFHLSRLLQIQNVPAIALSKISSNENSTWAGQRSQMEALEWADGNYVALIQWIPGLTEAHFPAMIQNEPYIVKADNNLMDEMDTPSLVTLVDWTDLVIFDFITAHIDRMTIIYDAIQKTGQKWLIKNAIHNLAKNKQTGALCIFDNECAFFASYPVILNKNFGRNISEMYDAILESVCVFRRSTVEAVRKLAEIDDIGGFLEDRLREDQTTAIFLKEAFNDRVPLHGMVKERILKVLDHIQKCQESGEGKI